MPATGPSTEPPPELPDNAADEPAALDEAWPPVDPPPEPPDEPADDGSKTEDAWLPVDAPPELSDDAAEEAPEPPELPDATVLEDPDVEDAWLPLVSPPELPDDTADEEAAVDDAGLLADEPPPAWLDACGPDETLALLLERPSTLLPLLLEPVVSAPPGPCVQAMVGAHATRMNADQCFLLMETPDKGSREAGPVGRASGSHDGTLPPTSRLGRGP